MDWFLYDNSFRHERVKRIIESSENNFKSKRCCLMELNSFNTDAASGGALQKEFLKTL